MKKFISILILRFLFFSNVNAENRKIQLDKISVRLFYDNLSKIGYTIKKTINLQNRKFNNNVVKAFQRRFRQELVNGKLDKECLIISNNLVKKF